MTTNNDSFYIAYFDESGDDGSNTSSSEFFVLTSLYMPSSTWREIYDLTKKFRVKLLEEYGLPVALEFHTKDFICDKKAYRKFNFSHEVRREILVKYIKFVSSLQIKIVNVVIDKTKIDKNYRVLENALKYNIQRIENDSKGKWTYLVISDNGRITPMRRTARAICKYNPIPSKFYKQTENKPINYLVEDIMSKDSAESYLIQHTDFVSFFTYQYYKAVKSNIKISGRTSQVIDDIFIKRTMCTFKKGGIINLSASKDEFGLVVYPK